ncbi:hypothetical protein COO60DRAFT_1094162 [Scenedesmus sp. NREL 46B-D3]|nr:hypothetical protein COO60DRAFT_1094162 [Scenedesmus sp. NREL 46B-D3]
MSLCGHHGARVCMSLCGHHGARACMSLCGHHGASACMSLCGHHGARACMSLCGQESQRHRCSAGPAAAVTRETASTCFMGCDVQRRQPASLRSRLSPPGAAGSWPGPC